MTGTSASACNADTTPTQPHRNSNTHRTKNNTTNVVIQQNSRKLLMMDILMSETCWAHKKWNKIASDIKLVFYSSTTSKVPSATPKDCTVPFTTHSAPMNSNETVELGVHIHFVVLPVRRPETDYVVKVAAVCRPIFRHQTSLLEGRLVCRHLDSGFQWHWRVLKLFV